MQMVCDSILVNLVNKIIFVNSTIVEVADAFLLQQTFTTNWFFG